MKRNALLFVVLAALAITAFAQEEESIALEGRLTMVDGTGGQVTTMLKLANGDLVAVELPPGEAARLKLRVRAKIRVSGIFIGATGEGMTQARIMARTIARNGKTVAVENPVQLTEQDRIQLRVYEAQRLKVKAQEQDQARLQTDAQAQAGSAGGTGGGGTGKK